MKTIGEYKALAREGMKGSYGQSVIAFLGVVMFQSLLSGIFSTLIGDSQILLVAYNILNIIIAAIIVNPLLAGLSRFFLEQAQGRPDLNNLFYPFKTNLTNTVKVMLIRDVKLVLWMLPGIIVGTAGLAMPGMMDALTDSEVNMAAAFLPLVVVVFLIPGIIKSLEYSVINYIIAENPDIKSKDAFKMAREMMRGNKGRLFLLELSFVGWIILGAMAFGVGIFLVIPYVEAATAHFYLDVKKQCDFYVPEENLRIMDEGDTFGV